jgi:uroporphyrinogen-III decarboxylase
VNVVLRGTPAQVRADAERCLAAAMTGGGYILSTACSVSPASPRDNILQLRAAADSTGRYAREG